jgi:hypothetical protein
MFYGGATSSSFLVDVVCGEDLPDYRKKSVPLPFALGTAGKATAKCQSGHITGGGALISSPVDEAYVLASYPVDGKDHDTAPDDAWQVRAVNSDGADKTLTAYAICL